MQGKHWALKKLAVARMASDLSRDSFDSGFTFQNNHFCGGRITLSDSERTGRQTQDNKENPLGRRHPLRNQFFWNDWRAHMDRWTALDCSDRHGSPREMSHTWSRKLILMEDLIDDLHSLQYTIWEVNYVEGQQKQIDLFSFSSLAQGPKASKKSGELLSQSLAPRGEMIFLAEKKSGNQVSVRVDCFVSNERILFVGLKPLRQRYLQFQKTSNHTEFIELIAWKG